MFRDIFSYVSASDVCIGFALLSFENFLSRFYLSDGKLRNCSGIEFVYSVPQFHQTCSRKSAQNIVLFANYVFFFFSSKECGAGLQSKLACFLPETRSGSRRSS